MRVAFRVTEAAQTGVTLQEATGNNMGLLSEFRDFAIKGNMIDIAVGIIMGAAFGTVINSLVSDVIMPPIGAYLLNGVDFSKSGALLKAAGADGKGEIIWAVGKFIQALISFLVIAGAVFMLVKAVNAAKNMAMKPAPAAAPPPPPRQEVLLEEIRNALLKR
jgi:large conductance mechanosensitive channel